MSNIEQHISFFPTEFPRSSVKKQWYEKARNVMSQNNYMMYSLVSPSNKHRKYVVLWIVKIMTSFFDSYLSRYDEIGRHERLNVIYDFLVAGRLVIHKRRNLTAEGTIQNMENRLKLKVLLVAALKVRANYQAWIEYLDDPSTSNSNELMFLRNSPELAFTLWLSDHCGLFSLNPVYPFLVYNDEQELCNRSIIPVGSTIKGEFTLQQGMMWEKLGCPTILGVESNRLHAKLRKLREAQLIKISSTYNEPDNDDIGADVLDTRPINERMTPRREKDKNELLVTTVVNRCLRQYSFLIQTHNTRRPVWNKEEFYNHAGLVLALERESGQTSLLNIIHDLIPTLVQDFVAHYRTMSFRLNAAKVTASGSCEVNVIAKRIASYLEKSIVQRDGYTPIQHKACAEYVMQHRSDFVDDPIFAYLQNLNLFVAENGQAPHVQDGQGNNLHIDRPVGNDDWDTESEGSVAENDQALHVQGQGNSVHDDRLVDSDDLDSDPGVAENGQVPYVQGSQIHVDRSVGNDDCDADSESSVVENGLAPLVQGSEGSNDRSVNSDYWDSSESSVAENDQAPLVQGSEGNIESFNSWDSSESSVVVISTEIIAPGSVVESHAPQGGQGNNIHIDRPVGDDRDGGDVGVARTAKMIPPDSQGNIDRPVGDDRDGGDVGVARTTEMIPPDSQGNIDRPVGDDRDGGDVGVTRTTEMIPQNSQGNIDRPVGDDRDGGDVGVARTTEMIPQNSQGNIGRPVGNDWNGGDVGVARTTEMIPQNSQGNIGRPVGDDQDGRNAGVARTAEMIPPDSQGNIDWPVGSDDRDGGDVGVARTAEMIPPDSQGNIGRPVGDDWDGGDVGVARTAEMIPPDSQGNIGRPVGGGWDGNEAGVVVRSAVIMAQNSVGEESNIRNNHHDSTRESTPSSSALVLSRPRPEYPLIPTIAKKRAREEESRREDAQMILSHHPHSKRVCRKIHRFFPADFGIWNEELTVEIVGTVLSYQHNLDHPLEFGMCLCLIQLVVVTILTCYNP